MPESLSSLHGSMIFSRRRLTGVPSSALVFFWSPNLMPTIPRFTMAILMPAKPFSPSVCWCFHCSLDITPQKRLRLHTSSLFSRVTARDWGIAIWRSRAPCCATFAGFSPGDGEAVWPICSGRWGGGSAVSVVSGEMLCDNHAIQFQTLAAACGWNEGTLCVRFLEGLDYAIANKTSCSASSSRAG